MSKSKWRVFRLFAKGPPGADHRQVVTTTRRWSLRRLRPTLSPLVFPLSVETRVTAVTGFLTFSTARADGVRVSPPSAHTL